MRRQFGILKVPQLKEILKKNNLPLGGKKEELVERCYEAKTGGDFEDIDFGNGEADEEMEEVDEAGGEEAEGEEAEGKAADEEAAGEEAADVFDEAAPAEKADGDAEE